jgi:hypothetical protein
MQIDVDGCPIDIDGDDIYDYFEIKKEVRLLFQFLN